MRFINYLSLLILITVFSCKEKQNEVQPQTELDDQKTIQKFSISIDGKEYEGSLEGSIISLSVPYGSDIKVIRPTINVSQGFSISPSISEAVDFSKPVTYTLKNSKGKVIVYTVNVKILPSELAIKDLVITDQLGTAQIDTAKRTVTVNLPGTVNLSKVLIKSIVSSFGTTVDPGISKTIDFSATNSATFIVKDKDGHSKEWTVKVVKVLVDANDILSFEVEKSISVFEKLPVAIDATTRTIRVYHLNGVDMSAVHILKMDLSPGATIVGGAPFEINLSYGSKSLVVQAQNGDKQTWTIESINQGLSNKMENDLNIYYSISSSLPKFKVSLLKLKVIGYDFVNHAYISSAASYFDASVIGSVDIHPYIDASSSFLIQAGKIDDTYFNTTQYVIIPNDAEINTYEEMKLRFESSPTKLSSINIDKVFKVIAKIRGMDYYVLIDIKGTTGSSDKISVLFDYKY